MSRLQNAADAAAVAGAQTLINNENFSDYKSVTLTSKYPGKVSEQYRTAETAKIEAIDESRDVAKEYVAKNLSSNEDNIVNSWTKEKVEAETPALYEKGDNLYFVVQLREEVRHFFLPGWFGDMNAPVTAVALLTKSSTSSGGGGDGKSGMTRASENTEKPTMPNAPIQYDDEAEDTFVTTLKHYQNTNVIVGNWEVQNEYRQNVIGYEERFGNLFGEDHRIYDQAWNHFQDFYNHYAEYGLYRTQTIIVEDDVIVKSELTPETMYDDNSKNVDKYGERSSVAATSATINNNSSSTAYNTTVKNAPKTYKDGITETGNVGLPYSADRLDSINIDFRPEVTLSGRWLKEDWDITLGWDSNIGYSQSSNNRGNTWKSSTPESTIRLLRIHSSINFNGVYPARAEKYREKDIDGVTLLRDNDGKLLPDILWARIESEPILQFPDIINSKNKTKYLDRSLLLEKKGVNGVTALNSVNQIIINANCPNTGENDRPVIIFYEGPETNDVYEPDESSKKHVRDSKPIIFNLNVPFRCILFVPNSPVVIIGKAQNDFRGFVVAKEYMRLKDDSDFVIGGQKMWLGLERTVYYAKDDTKQTKPCYKTTDENGIDMFVDELGDIQFSKIDNPKKCGTYDTFGRTNLAASTDYFVAPHLAYNLLIMAPPEE